MTAPTIEVRATCTALRHDTASAYRKWRCRCPQARAAEHARKRAKQYGAGRRHDNPLRLEQLTGHTTPGVPPFYAHPARGCANLKNPNIMFPKYADQLPAAVEVCQRCPFQQECASWAFDTGQTFGVYGGIGEKERRRLIAARLLAGAA